MRTSIAAGLVFLLVVGLPGAAAVPVGAALGGDEPAIEVRPGSFRASDGTDLGVDAYLPRDGVRRPAIVLVHGGSWAGGDKADVANLAAGLADRGWAVFALGYRLGVEQVPRQAEDVRDAVRWLRRNAPDYGVDPDAISLLGASAGGHLAALAATGADPASRVAAVATWSGIFNLAALAPHGSARVPGCGARCEEFFGAGVLTGVVGCTFDECPARYRRQSPVTHVGPDAPPMFLAGTTGDAVPPGQAREMAAALRADGVESELAILRGDEHGYEVGARVLDRTLDFLEDRTVEEVSPSSSGTPWGPIAAAVALVLGAVVVVVVTRRRRAAGPR